MCSKRTSSRVTSVGAQVFLWICLGAGIAGCSSVPVDEHQLTPLKVNASRQTLDGTLVSVRGYLVIEGEDRALFESEDRFGKGKGRDACTSLLLTQGMDDQLRPLTGMFVTVSGVFRKNVMDDGAVHLGLCNFTGVEVSGFVPSPPSR